MEEATKSFIDSLVKARSRFELLVEVKRQQEEFYNNTNSKKEPFRSEDEQIQLERTLDEINYIEHGLNTSVWMKKPNDEKRFDTIKEAIQNILKKFNNIINFLEIENFKSIKQLEIKCKRINVFIGKPNVGKSNILEALGMFSSPYGTNSKYFSDFIRYKNLTNLFYDNNTKSPVRVKNNLGIAYFNYLETINNFSFFIAHDEEIIKESLANYPNVNDIQNRFSSFIDNKNRPKDSVNPLFCYIKNNGSVDTIQYATGPSYLSTFKKYDFRKPEIMNNPFHHFLLPPDGRNLAVILQQESKLFNDAAHLFDEYGLDLVLREAELELDILKKIERRVYAIPYTLVADTLQRMIFYFAAIRSNHDSVLIFEEPEAHAFPPYTDMIAEEMIKATSNQFFISTHSPYLLNKLIENCPRDESSIFKCLYKDYSTDVQELSETEIKEISDYGVDIFYHI